MAVAAITLSVLGLSFGDAFLKSLSLQNTGGGSGLVVSQVFVLRSALILPSLLLYVWLRKAPILRDRLTGTFGWQILRALLLVGMWLAYYAALPYLPLSVAAAGMYTLPLFITLFTVLFLREPIPGPAWFALIPGVLGVLLVLRPDIRGVTLHVLLPLLAALCYALAMIITRAKCRASHPAQMALALNLAFLAAGLAMTGIGLWLPASQLSEAGLSFLMGGWTPMGRYEWICIAVMTGAMLNASLLTSIAYQNASPAVVGLFDLAYVGGAVVWGVLLLREVPSALTVLGIALIVGAAGLSLRGSTRTAPLTAQRDPPPEPANHVSQPEPRRASGARPNQ